MGFARGTMVSKVSPLVNSAKIHTKPHAGLHPKSYWRSDIPQGASVPEILIAVVGHRLAVVAGLTKRLPVGFVPEEDWVAAMGNDVVDDDRGA